MTFLPNVVYTLRYSARERIRCTQLLFWSMIQFKDTTSPGCESVYFNLKKILTASPTGCDFCISWRRIGDSAHVAKS